MSYSRWGSSVWYTYADAKGGFTICEERNFTDADLKNIPNCIQWFRDKYKAMGKEVYTEDELQELAGYMQKYLDDPECGPGGRFTEILKKRKSDEAAENY